MLIAKVVCGAALVLLAGTTTVVSAQVYKCFENGEIIYQEAPCDGSGQLMDIPLKTQHGGAFPEEPAYGNLQEEGEERRDGLSDEEVNQIVDALQERVYAEEEDMQEIGPLASCRGIEIYDVLTYDVGGQTFVRRWPYGGYYRKRYISSGRVQCASLEIMLPGYYGRIFENLDERFTHRFIAVFVDGTARIADTVSSLPDGRVNTTARYRIDLCFGPSEIPIDYVTCE
ncbi:MAG: hypothetical protein P8Y83_00015 [Gammaproteobacteria bacterium]